MLTVHILASGSEGNSLLVSGEGTHVLLDAGISARRITAALRELGLSPRDLSGVLLTHEHSDHVSGLATLVKQARRCSPRSGRRAPCAAAYRLPPMCCAPSPGRGRST